MSQRQRLKAFVLRRSLYRDSDLIVTFLTSQGSKLSLLARGAVKSKKRFGGGVLEPTHLVEIEYTKPTSEGRLGMLVEAQILESFVDVRSDYDRLMVGLRCVESVTRVAQEGDVHSQSLFQLLGRALFDLQYTKDLAKFEVQFELQLQHQQGELLEAPWMNSYLKNP